ncbi:RadC family protein [Pseudomonas chlororaphis]|uniref:RadC family protein n=1 Tax=Pseudomonas chlororaphis TaxID=587753 RepID=UPI0004714DD1|nr:DNA repair protein RadC [Pseudomonas chlororaphis]
MNISEAIPRKPSTLLFDTQQQAVIEQAILLLESRLFQRGEVLKTQKAVEQFLQLKLAASQREVFALLFLDSKHRVIAFEELFHGSINSTSIHPRVVMQRALHHNAAAAILAHNHPSGVTEPSQADRSITSRLKELLELIDVQVLDHFIVGQGNPFSFAEAGLL